MPVPTAGCSPEVGTLALLLSVMRLCSMIRHDAVWLFGHRPSCGGGESSLLSEFGASPVRLWSKTEFVITNRPPALVPEYPRAELLPRSKASLASQTPLARADVVGGIGHVAGVGPRDRAAAGIADKDPVLGQVRRVNIARVIHRGRGEIGAAVTAEADLPAAVAAVPPDLVSLAAFT